MDILYEDNHLIAVQKPHGLLTQGDATGDDSLFDQVKAFIKNREHKPGNVFLGLLHRLDRPVGGVVLFAKTSKAASRLSEQFRNRSIEKVYWAVSEHKEKGDQSKAGEIVQWLIKDEQKNMVTAYDHQLPGAQRAELSYLILEDRGDTVLSEIRPKTGRPHQIRVALSSIGLPIIGDKKYGASRRLPGGAIGLFARSLSFNHPIDKKRITVIAKPELAIF